MCFLGVIEIWMSLRIYIKILKTKNNMKNLKSLNHVVFAIGMLAIIFSCNENGQKTGIASEQLIRIPLDPTKVNDVADFISKIENIRFLSLENTSNNPIDYVRKLWATDNEYMLLTDNNEFHKYTHSGQFILKKAIEGKGKAEVNSLKDFSAGKNGDFYILSYKEYYHFDNKGKFLKTYPLSFPYKDYNPSQFFIANDTFQIYCTYNTTNNGHKENENFYYCMYIQNKQEDSFKQMLYRHTCPICDCTFMQCNDDILINPVLGNDTIYKWNGVDVRPLYYIDFGKYKIPVEEIPQDYSIPFTMLRYAADNNRCNEISRALMSNDWLFFNYRFGKDTFICCYNKNKNDYVLLSLNDDKTKSLFLDSWFLAVKNNEFIISIAAYRIKERIESNSLDFKFLSEARHQEIIAQLKKVKETDNPVLMFLKMKKE